MLRHNEEKQILSVSSLARQARLLLEQNFANLWVEGELSNLSKPRSGHWYFTLKDKSAQIRCAMFANRNRSVQLPVRDGLQVMVRGRVSLYEGRGDFQIIVEHLEPAGEGALRAAFDALKTKLTSQGLFDDARKRSLPTNNQHLAIITSATGAALRDVLQIIQRRYPALRITLLPVAVQGPNAEPEILAAFNRLPKLSAVDPIDAVLLTRGGGSLEDLWAFNLETVALAVANSPIPVVSAIGHQTDFAITDFIADLRAPTPSAAAELLTQDGAAVAQQLTQQAGRLQRAFNRYLTQQQQRLNQIRARLVDPQHQLRNQQQRIDELDQRLERAIANHLGRHSGQLANAQHRLWHSGPQRLLQTSTQQLHSQRQRLVAAANSVVNAKQGQLENRVRTLQVLNPLQTLTRGFAVLTQQGQAIERSAGLTPGSELAAYMADGAVDVRVTGVRPGASLEPNQPSATPALSENAAEQSEP